jgi:P4 family phage/plasmid primase-like protien
MSAPAPSPAAGQPITVPGDPLTAADYAMLERSGITKAAADRALLRRIDSATGAQILGRNGSGDYSGILFTNLWPGENWARDQRVRRDHPEMEFRDGRFKPKGKYLSHGNARNLLYIPPGIRPEWLADVVLPIVIVEGEKKAISLNELAWQAAGEGAERPRWITIAITGAWNWRGTIGKTEAADGSRVPVKGVIPDFDRIPWLSRRVTIIYDANVYTNGDVENARNQLAWEFRKKRKAKVLFVDIPAEPGVNGVDDLIGLWGAERVLDLITTQAYDPKKQPKAVASGGPKWDPSALAVKNGDDPEPCPSFDEKGRLVAAAPTMGNILLHRFHFAKNDGDQLFVFREGAYRPNASELIRSACRGLMIEWRTEPSWKSAVAHEIAEWVTIPSPKLWDRPPLDRINVLNGILHLESRRLEPHNADWLSPVQLPVVYDPSATCAAWDDFLLGVLPADVFKAQIAFEIVALLMIPFTSGQRALLLRGPRGTGKSRFLAAIRSFLGSENTSSKSLHTLEENRFASAYLYGKLANICADLPTHDLESTSRFKAVTGEDYIDAEIKHGKQFQFRPFARLLFSANEPPTSKDATDAFLDRWWVIPFENRFQDGAEHISAAELDARLSQPNELSGVLNRALEMLPAVLKRKGISQAEAMQKAHDDFCATTDPFRVWLSQYVEEDDEAFTPCEDVRASYFQFRRERYLKPISPTAFGIELKKHKPGVDMKQRTVQGRSGLPWCYITLRLKEMKKNDGDRSVKDAE